MVVTGGLGPIAVEVPYSNQAVVAWPFGLTVPFSLAPDAVTEDAAAVVTTGAEPVVENVSSAPLVVPASLTATTRKW